MVDFSSLLKKPAGEAKKPPALPAGDYHGIIKQFELGDQNKNRTPYVRLSLGFLDWPTTADDESKVGIDLAKRQMRRDYYLTDDALWRLDELIRGLGIEGGGRGYDEVLPELVGQHVLVVVIHKLNEESNETFNEVQKVVPMPA